MNGKCNFKCSSRHTQKVKRKTVGLLSPLPHPLLKCQVQNRSFISLAHHFILGTRNSTRHMVNINKCLLNARIEEEEYLSSMLCAAVWGRGRNSAMEQTWSAHPWTSWGTLSKFLPREPPVKEECCCYAHSLIKTPKCDHTFTKRLPPQ